MAVIQKALYKCKKCKNKMIDDQQLSGNNLHAKMYSDLFIDSPMGFPSGWRYIACSNCGMVYFKDHIFKRVINKEPSILTFFLRKLSFLKSKNQPTNPLVGLDKIKAIINSNVSCDRMEVLLWYLWHTNHNSDKEELKKEKNSGDYDKYRKELFDIVNKSKEPDFIILSAELSREKGNFDLAIKTLQENNFGETYKEMVEIILNKALKKDSKIFVLKG